MFEWSATSERDLDTLARASGLCGAICVRCEGKVRFANAYGHADRRHGIPNEVGTRFAIASGTKLLTALAVGQLIDRGLLALDEPLQRCAQIELPNLDPAVCIRDLLAHRSGVYDYLDEELIADLDEHELAIPFYRLRRPRDYLPLLLAGPAKFTPGSRFAYSNSGYVLLGLAIEARSGMAFTDYVQSQIFDALAMADSGFFASDSLPPQTALGYLEPEPGLRTNLTRLPIVGGPDGGAFSTLADIARLWRAVLDGEILSAALLQRYLAPSSPPQQGRSYGYGMWLAQHGESWIPSIQGQDAGVSFFSLAVAADSVATVMSNTSSGALPVVPGLRQILGMPVRAVAQLSG